MKTLKNQKYLSYFLLGLALILPIVGAIAGLVSGSWSPIPLGLIITGIAIAICTSFFVEGSKKGFWGRRSTQVSGNAILATLAVLIILGLANFLALRYPLRVDLTENQVLTLSPQSQQVVRELEQPVKVWVFDRTPNPETRGLLENYRRYNPQFTFSFVDPQQEPGLAGRFGVKSFGEVYVESGKKRQLIHTPQQGERLTESKLTNGIEQLKSDRIDKIYFLQGHEELSLEEAEAGLSEAIGRLQQKSYVSEPLNLTRETEIPSDATVIVVAGPKQPLFPEEVTALSNYLDAGGSLLVMVDPTVNSGLDSLLARWGVVLDNRLAIDASGKGSVVGLGIETPVVSSYSDHPIVQEFRSGTSFYRLARPLELKPVDGIEQTPLLLTDENSWAESNIESENLEFNEGRDRKGPLILGAALRKEKAQGDNKQEPRLVVFGNSSFAANVFFTQQLNGDVLINSIGWLSERDRDVLSISPKESNNRRINLTPQQATLTTAVALGVIPLLALSAAGFVWWRRR